MIIQNFIDKVTNLICAYINMNCNINEKNNTKIKYALVAVIGELLKIIILIIIFLVFNKIIYFLFSLTMLILIRTFSGGLHFKTFNKCMLFSITVFIITSLLAPLLPKFPDIYYYILGIVSILLIFINAPCPSFKRPIKDKKRRYRFKLISSFLSIFCLIGLLVLKNDVSLLNCGFSTVLIQSLQLAFANSNILFKYRERTDTN